MMIRNGGYYFGKFVDHVAYGPDNPACPGDVAVVTPTNVTHEKDALSRAELSRCPLVLGAGLVPFCTRWDLVRAVLVHVESPDVAGVNREVRRARRMMRQHHHGVLRPVILYTAQHVHWASVATRPGVQAYLEPGEAAAAFLDRVDGLLEEARRRQRRIALHWGAYDRRPKAVDRAALDEAQAALPDLVKRHRPVIGDLLLFSDGRAGGTRAYPHWYPHHEAAFAALQGAL